MATTPSWLSSGHVRTCACASAVECTQADRKTDVDPTLAPTHHALVRHGIANELEQLSILFSARSVRTRTHMHVSRDIILIAPLIFVGVQSTAITRRGHAVHTVEALRCMEWAVRRVQLNRHAHNRN